MPCRLCLYRAAVVADLCRKMAWMVNRSMPALFRVDAVKWRTVCKVECRLGFGGIQA